MSKLFQTPAQIGKIETLQDRTIKITAYCAKELAGEEMQKLFALNMKEGWLLFAENVLQVSDVPKEKAIVDKEAKSLSTRLRNVMYVYFSQNYGADKSFEEWRIKEMEKIIQAYKNKLI